MAEQEKTEEQMATENQNAVNDPLFNVNDEKADEFEFNTVTASPSVESLSSSLIGNLKFDDDFTFDTKDIFVKVDNPEKHSTAMESYITFRISCKTTRSDYDSHEYCVRKRYNDFIWLHQKLEERYPTHIVPPLPEKHSMQRLNRFNPDFIKSRMIALNKFLNRVAEHPVLSFDNYFKIFLTAKPFEFASHRKQSTGFIGRMSESLHNLAAIYMIKNRSPEFEQMNDYIYKLNDKLGNVERIAQRINREQADYVGEMNEFHPVFKLWSSSETKLNPALAVTAIALEKCAKAQAEIIKAYEESYQQPLREYILYTEAIKEVLKRRDAIQIEYELTLEELNKRKAEREQLQNTDQIYSFNALFGKETQSIKQEKQNRLDKMTELLISQAEENNDKAECANSDLKADMERWEKTKERDIKDIFINLAKRQIHYYQQCLQAWEEAIPIIKDLETDYSET